MPYDVLDTNTLYDVLATTPSPTSYEPVFLEPLSVNSKDTASSGLLRASSNSSTETEEAEFFRAIYLDSPATVSGSTQPLRVRKKHGARVPPIGPARRRRKSTISLPHTPRSPSSPRTPPTPGTPRTPTSPMSRSRPVRTPSNTSIASAHRAISQAFLSLPISPMPPVHPFNPSSSHSRNQRSTSGQSELHLGLGLFGAYDESARPGPSLPTSPAPSLTKRNYMYLTPPRTIKPLPSSPLMPMTPSRAPRKAAELLGLDYSQPPKRRGKGKPKRKEHFRPLPASTLFEIERFFGDVPKKPSRTPPRPISNIDTHSSSENAFSRGKGATADPARDDLKTTCHIDEEGRMWVDVEEEQEFAWLMSEAAFPWPVTSESDELLYRSPSASEEDDWGMRKFTSVLSLSDKEAGKKHRKEESWLELETPLPRKVERTKILELPVDASLRSTKALPKTPNQSGLSSSLPSTSPLLLQTPPRSSSRSPPTISGSPPKAKTRPPPHTRSNDRPRGNLPVITATTPTHPRRTHKAALSIEVMPLRRPLLTMPNTPFAHPRPAPAPGNLPPKLILPSQYSVKQAPPHLSVEEEPMSFFEPVTPIVRTGPNSTIKAKASAGGTWFKKVVKPLGVVRI